MRRLQRDCRVVSVVFAVLAAATVASIVANLLELRLVSETLAGSRPDRAALDANDARQNAIGIVRGVAELAAVWTFMTWFGNAYAWLASSRRRFAPLWAYGGWFVPVLNLWRPKQILDDIWRAGGARDRLLPNAWWALFVASSLIGFIGPYFLDEHTASHWRDEDIAWVASDALELIAMLYAVLLVRSATDQLRSAVPA